VITVKSDIEIAGGLHRREELESPATRSLDPAQWPDSPAKSRVVEVAGGRRLIERFRAEQERHEVEAQLDGTVVVVSLDEADIWTAGRLAGSLKQLEVELRSGDETALRFLAEEIAAAGIGVPESRSKMAIALAMVGEAEKTQATDTMAAAGRLVLRRQLLRMLERETGARAGDTLAIKQMRVATRRMRAAWRTFGSAYRKAARQRYVEELRRVAGALGEVRDMDVLLEGLPDDAALAPLADAWHSRRADAQTRLVTLFDDAAYDKFVRDYLDFTNAQGSAVAHDAPAQTLGEAAPRLLVAGADRLREGAARALWGRDEQAWHAMRISAKRLRYSVEQLREAIGDSAATAAIARLVRLQDALGAMNDAAVAAREAETWLAVQPGAPLATKAAIESYVAAQQATITRLRAEFAPIWQGAANLFTER
jgi:CHAD domain-containing protein